MGMFGLRIFGSLIFTLTFLFGSMAALAQTNNPLIGGDVGRQLTSQDSGEAAARGAIPPGTIITIENWRRYKQYMPDGMIALFEGSYFWKMPPDVSMEVGATIIN